MKKSANTVQQWVNTLPQPPTTPATPNVPTNSSSQAKPHLTLLGRDVSLQSDDNSSHCSSVESVLESRRPDPEAVLIELGFGPPHTTKNISRIPKRFLQPSQLIKNIDFNKFLEQQELEQCNYKYRSVPSSPARQRPKSC